MLCIEEGIDVKAFHLGNWVVEPEIPKA
jgi:hypothetical protein